MVTGLNEKTMMVEVKFRVCGDVRFLSHLETARVLARALIRAGFRARYSQGYNPHMRMSLPLPRQVAVESDAELFCVELEQGESEFDADDFRRRFGRELVEGLEILDVSISSRRKAARPVSVKYVVTAADDCGGDDIRARIKAVLASERIELERAGRKGRGPKVVDVRGYIESMEFDGRDISVECKISPSGSIRADEIMELLGLDGAGTALPVRRVRVDWQQ